MANQKYQKSPDFAGVKDKHRLYELSVQDTEASIELIDTIYKRSRKRLPRSLREDFCGTAKLCADWARQGPRREATGLDIDARTLAWASKNNIGILRPQTKKRVQLIETDVLDYRGEGFDVAVAFNFSYFVFKTRSTLKTYFENVRRSLKEDGLFLIDVFGGPDTQFIMKEETEHNGFVYIWDQSSFNPVNNHIVCQIHYRLEDGTQIRKAFTYDWRLWSIQELREILEESGFTRCVVWWDCDDDILRPTESTKNLIAWVAYIAAWK